MKSLLTLKKRNQRQGHDLNRVMDMLPVLPSNAEWEDFEDALELCNSGKHLTQTGFDAILKMKGH